MKQSDKLTAYYFRAAQQIDTLYLDNQMQRLLYHASQNGIAAFALYADNGYNGLNFDRPAFSLMQQDMRNGRLEKIIVASLDRISANCSTQSVKRGSPRSHFKQCLAILCARSAARHAGRGYNGFI